jgi:hypothetical protein
MYSGSVQTVNSIYSGGAKIPNRVPTQQRSDPSFGVKVYKGDGVVHRIFQNILKPTAIESGENLLKRSLKELTGGGGSSPTLSSVAKHYPNLLKSVLSGSVPTTRKKRRKTTASKQLADKLVGRQKTTRVKRRRSLKGKARGGKGRKKKVSFINKRDLFGIGV